MIDQKFIYCRVTIGHCCPNSFFLNKTTFLCKNNIIMFIFLVKIGTMIDFIDDLELGQTFHIKDLDLNHEVTDTSIHFLRQK